MRWKFLYQVIKLLNRYRGRIFFLIYIPAVFFFHSIFNDSWTKSLYDAAALFALDIREKTNFEAYAMHDIVYLFAFLAGLYTVLTVIELLVRDNMKESMVKSIATKGAHTVVIGLGESNRIYIDSELSEDNTSQCPVIVIEKDPSNPYIEKYQEKVGVVVSDARFEQILNDVGIKQAEQTIISTGDDIVNLEIAMEILALKPTAKLFLHIQDRNLRYFHRENSRFSGTNIKVYSYHEEAARELFTLCDIDGEGSNVITSYEPFAIMILGNTLLAYEVVAQACMMGQLPHENKLTIYCVDKDPQKFKESILLFFMKIDMVPNVELVFLEMDPDTPQFYEHELWKKELTNIILCYEEDQKNLDIALNLTNITFLEKIVEQKMRTNILMAMFNAYTLGERIKKNNTYYNHLHVFGRIRDINDKKFVVGGERDRQAIATDFIYSNVKPVLANSDTYASEGPLHYTYRLYIEDGKGNEKSDVEKQAVEEYGQSGFIAAEKNDNWLELPYIKKESNRAVADHMKMKLKYLGFKIGRSSLNDTKAIYLANKKTFDKFVKDKVLLARMEHNRWNAFHFLQGFSSASEFVCSEEKERLEAKKFHICLRDFDDFHKNSETLIKLGYEQGKFEGYDFLINDHIPLILASAGYVIQQPISVGVTGHRKLRNGLKYIVQKEIRMLSERFSFEKVYSPLADGADRFVGDEILEKYGAKLIVPLPFDVKRYKEDFSKESLEEFDTLLSRACQVFEVEHDKGTDDNTNYLDVGKYVVDHVDILIALWDGKAAAGKGGTGDIVAYAMEKGKAILHINTDTYEVERKNFDRFDYK